jgi:hypothetical protein
VIGNLISVTGDFRRFDLVPSSTVDEDLASEPTSKSIVRQELSGAPENGGRHLDPKWASFDGFLALFPTVILVVNH